MSTPEEIMQLNVDDDEKLVRLKELAQANPDDEILQHQVQGEAEILAMKKLAVEQAPEDPFAGIPELRQGPIETIDQPESGAQETTGELEES